MKRILPEYSFSGGQLNTIKALAADCNLSEGTVSILYGRGIDSTEKIKRFLTPGKENFISPFKMSGMKEAADLITRARDEGWDVLIYGDYDCDGVCASTIMHGVLTDYGVNAVAYVPERKGGYGLNKASIDEILEEFFPELVITVDCGISCAEEVEYLKECGCEVIVTDHHELPDSIPDCICVNPKFNDDYPYDNLCGAGVAFKVGCALLGSNAYKYLDFAALATVADSVPLTGENRDIVAEGLKMINSSPRSCIANFLTKSQEEVTAHTLAFTIAPKVNAAGRMGDAASALALFSAEDEKEIFSLSAKLTAYNQERQLRCDELYLSAKEKLASRGAYGKVIMLADDGWNSGFTGIVAARLADEYGRPTILFVKNGDTLKGSARSIDGVNIFDALKACDKYISEFGGHSQAAGVNVDFDCFDSLERALNEYLDNNYTAEDFIPTIYINGSLDDPRFSATAKELSLLEPFGVGNKKPLFAASVNSCPVKQLKPASSHLTFKCGGLDFMYFGGVKNTRLLECPAPKQLVYEYNVSHFRGREYVKGFVRDVIYPADSGAYAQEYIAFNAVINASLPAAGANVTLTEHTQIDDMLSRHTAGYGTLLVAMEYSTLSAYSNLGKFGTDLFALSTRSLADTVLVAPQADCDFTGYNKIIFLDKPAAITFPCLSGKDVTVCSDICGYQSLLKLDCDRQSLLQVFAYLTANAGQIEGNSAEEAAAYPSPYAKSYFLFALKVFEQLGLIGFRGGSLLVYRGIKTDLKNSQLYNLVDGIKKMA
ncbi:MAG: single-stranded-DNA-specific exonuclease RecJ [Clostridia bacterium]|nr:single-stranded-DNA-specific exonuclease RecJ [Clostridia bacterium]